MNRIDQQINEALEVVDDVLTLQSAGLDPELQSLIDAIDLIRECRVNVLSGPMFPWTVLEHADIYLDKQISALMREAV